MLKQVICLNIIELNVKEDMISTVTICNLGKKGPQNMNVTC